MSRRVEETIEVRLTSPEEIPSGASSGTLTTGGEPSPDQFLWRGRLYRVTGVVDRWQERRSWWREAIRERPLGAVPTGRQVWRVEASPGRSGVPGVYDLADAEGPDGSWRLLRTQD